jgi:hypothetical protein
MTALRNIYQENLKELRKLGIKGRTIFKKKNEEKYDVAKWTWFICSSIRLSDRSL